MMKGVKPVVLLGTLILAEPAFSQDNEVAPVVSFEVTRAGGVATVSIQPLGEDVFLPACRGVVWEQFVAGSEGNEGRYVSLTEEPCGAAKPPIKVSKDGVQYQAPAIPGGGTAVLRAVAVVGLGCAPDRPMAVGECRQVLSQISKNITISPEHGG